MRFTLSITTDGAAFADDETGEVDAYSASREVARILGDAAGKVGSGVLVDGSSPVSVFDENGNRVGAYALEVDA